MQVPLRVCGGVQWRVDEHRGVIGCSHGGGEAGIGQGREASKE